MNLVVPTMSLYIKSPIAKSLRMMGKGRIPHNELDGELEFGCRCRATRRASLAMSPAAGNVDADGEGLQMESQTKMQMAKRTVHNDNDQTRFGSFVAGRNG